MGLISGEFYSDLNVGMVEIGGGAMLVKGP